MPTSLFTAITLTTATSGRARRRAGRDRRDRSASTPTTRPPSSSTGCSTAWCSAAGHTATPCDARRIAVLSLSVPHPVNTTSPGATPITLGDLVASLVDRRRASPGEPMRTARVGEPLGEERQHRLDRARPHRRGRRMIEIGHCPSPPTLPTGRAHRHRSDERRYRSTEDECRWTDTTTRTYGEAFADVYDEWYEGVSDVAATGRDLAGSRRVGGRVLELGVGTGRLAVPLAVAGRARASRDRDRHQPGDARPTRRAATPTARSRPSTATWSTICPTARSRSSFVAYNTFFNLARRRPAGACFAAVADRLTPADGSSSRRSSPTTATRRRRRRPCGRCRPTGSCCRSVATTPSSRSPTGQFVEFTEAGGVRLRPWSIRYATPDGARRHGRARPASSSSTAWDVVRRRRLRRRLADRHVSVYRTDRDHQPDLDARRPDATYWTTSRRASALSWVTT